MKENVVRDKSYFFALRMVKVYKYLTQEQREFVLSKQALRSGTSVGALVREAEHAQSDADFVNKMNIALKEANESIYWIELFIASDILDKKQGESIWNDCNELISLLVSIIKTSKKNINAADDI